MHCSHHTDLLLFSLNLDFDLFLSTRKYVSPGFWRKLSKLFSFNIYSLLFIQCISSHIFCKSWGTWSWDFWWDNTKGRYGGNNPGANYNSGKNTQKKGVSWSRGSSKTGKILNNTSEGFIVSKPAGWEPAKVISL